MGSSRGVAYAGEHRFRKELEAKYGNVSPTSIGNMLKKNLQIKSTFPRYEFAAARKYLVDKPKNVRAHNERIQGNITKRSL
jgi:hypothetical protein